MSAMPEPKRSQPDDYWLSPSFCHRYTLNNILVARDNPGAREYYMLAMMALAQGISYLVPKPACILDAGCGPAVRGNTLRAMLKCDVHGFDYSEAMLAEAGKFQDSMDEANRVTLHKADVAALPFPDGAYDAAYTYGLLMSLPDPAVAIHELLRVVRYGLVCIEECVSLMNDTQRVYYDNMRIKMFPGRIYWHDYIGAFGDAATLSVTPLHAPESWDMGQPPAYARFIAVKRPPEGAV